MSKFSDIYACLFHNSLEYYLPYINYQSFHLLYDYILNFNVFGVVLLPLYYLLYFI